MIERFLASSLHRATSTTSRLEDDTRLSRDLHVPASPPLLAARGNAQGRAVLCIM
jgi:hypothetical protein